MHHMLGKWYQCGKQTDIGFELSFTPAPFPGHTSQRVFLGLQAEDLEQDRNLRPKP